ncbi:MAG TPA: lysophospholipid acyltransferase family protein [Phycisphaerales bacterium]|nr:lysophospholipid acyltransferase family protein [Phycisphaerales bacterium]
MLLEWIVYGVVGCLLLLSIIYWCVLPALGRHAMGDGITALLWFLNKLYVRLIHRLKASGTHIIPDTLSPGPLVVICNHQSPVDPLLVQSQCRFKIRWLMAEEFMLPAASFVWKLSEVIPVARDNNDTAGLRKALGHLRKNGVIGIFPEGGIKEPRCHVHPFLEGAGAMIAKTKAKVLLAIVDGTPQNDEMSKALIERSASTVAFVELRSFPENQTGKEITTELRNRIAEITGWPLVN